MRHIGPKPYYERGGVMLHHGDALEQLEAMVSNDQQIDLCVTDPPYVIGAVSAGNMASKSGGWGDMMNSARWFRDWYALIRDLLAPDGALWSFCNWRTLPVVMRAALDAQWSVTSMLVWDKQWIGPGGLVGLRPSYELAALMAMPEFAVPDRGTPDIWREKWSSRKPHGHPAEKPQALMQRIIETSDKAEGLILDPFSGSGTTLAAAASVGARAIGIEAEERYCEIAARRMDALFDSRANVLAA